MAGITLTLTGDQAVQHTLNQLLKQCSDLSAPLAEIGEYLTEVHQQRWQQQVAPDGSPWEPLSEVTVAMKGHSTILKDSKTLIPELHYQITNEGLFFGSNEVYSAMMHFGGTTSPNSMIPNVEIPARNFLGLNNDDENEVLAILNDDLENALSGV